MIEGDLDHRPTIIAIAGSNGAGKSTFYETKLASLGFPFVNADVLAKEHRLHPYDAAKAADVLRRDFVLQRRSFVFETVLSDPNGEKVEFLKQASDAGFNVILCFIAIRDSHLSEQRVSMRVSQGGHDVPSEKLHARYARTLKNLQRAIDRLPLIHIYDNTDLSTPYRHILTIEHAEPVTNTLLISDWISDLLIKQLSNSERSEFRDIRRKPR